MTPELKSCLTLMGRALRGEKADEGCFLGAEPSSVFELARRSAVAGLCFFPLEAASELRIGGELLGRWESAREKAVRRSILFIAERDAVCRELEAAGIWNAVLKGGTLLELYPAIGMRELTDIDILVDNRRMDDIEALMLERGYRRIRHYGQGADDEYHKEPVYNFEIHRSLFGSHRVPELAAHFADIRGSLVATDSAHPLMLSMEPEDAYAYLVAHAWRHHSQRGTGLRILADIAVFEKAFPDLDRARIETACESRGIASFERTLRGLARAALAAGFSPENLGEEELVLAGELAESGLEGSYERRVSGLLDEAEAKGWSKARYLASRAFPEASFYKEHYPFAWRHPWARPFALVSFWTSILLTPSERAKIPVELAALMRRGHSNPEGR